MKLIQKTAMRMVEGSMQNWITDFMGQFGYISVFLLITLENIFPPIPSEVILTFGGFMTTNTEMTIPGVIGIATLGSVLGAIILYGIGRLLDLERLEKIINRWGHILRVKVSDIQKADSWFKRYGYWTVFFCRMVPLIRSLISIPAGMAKMKMGLFLLFTIVGTLIWNTLLVTTGAFLGESWTDILKYMDLYSNITYAVLGIAFVVFVAVFLFKRRNKKNI